MDAAPREEPNERTWYGWQTLTTDGVSLAVALSAIPAESDELALTALGGYLLGGPIAHAAHDNWGRAFGSLGIRTGLPVLMALIGVWVEDCHGGDFCGIGGTFVGGTVGVVGAVALDAAVLAYDDPPVEETSALRLNLALDFRRRSLGLSGAF
jgi:hypothetical protein